MSRLRRFAAKRALGRTAAAVACACVIALLTGCVPAESTRYRGTMSRSVKPEHRASADVAGAFGLTGNGGTAVNLAAAGE